MGGKRETRLRATAGLLTGVCGNVSTGDSLPRPGSGPQVPLSLRWETRHHWRALRDEFDCSRTGAAIILALVTAGDAWTSYSRAKDHYAQSKRYRSPLYTYASVVGAVDRLSAQGLIYHDRAPRGRLGWQSAMKATPELIGRTSQVLEGLPPLEIARPTELIILRDADGVEVDYRDTRATDRMRRLTAAFNEMVQSCALSEPILRAPMRRIFNETFRRGGRFYAMGNSWQNMKKEARRRLLIEDQPVVEIDYTTLHPALLYADAGKPFAGDAYDLDGWPRQLVKRAFNIMVNARNEPSARRAIAILDDMAALAKPGTQEAFHAAQKLIDAIKRKHGPIAHAFFSDAGAFLMSVDSTLAEKVMEACLLHGVTVLPVHDSFLVRHDQADFLEEAMQKAAYEVVKFVLKTSRAGSE